MAENMTQLTIAIVALDQATRELSKVSTVLKNMAFGVNQVNKQMKRFDMNILSLIFGGMALQRIFGGALRSMFNTYVQVIDVHDRFFQKTQHLRAAWEFLKFAMIDALTQSDLFFVLLDFLIGAVNAIGQFVNEHPALTRMVMILIAMFAVIGSIGLAYGIARQSMHLFYLLTLDLKTAIKAAGTALTAISKNPIVLLIIAVIGLMFWFIKLRKEYGNTADVFVATGATILEWIGWISDALILLITVPIRLLLLSILYINKGLAKLGFKGFVLDKEELNKISGVIDSLKYGFISKALDPKIVEARAGLEARKLERNKAAAEYISEGNEELESSLKGIGKILEINQSELNAGIKQLAEIPGKVKEGVKEGMREEGGVFSVTGE